MFLNKPFFLLRLTIFHLTSPFRDLWSTLTPFRSQKGRRLWPELVLSALSRWRFTLVFLKMVFFCETKVVSKFKLVFFCETKVVSSHFGGILVSKAYDSCFFPKFTICWVSNYQMLLVFDHFGTFKDANFSIWNHLCPKGGSRHFGGFFF